MIRIAIIGYGNLGRGVQTALRLQPDMTLVGIFTRRDPASLEVMDQAPTYALTDLDRMLDQIDVAILCGGSATDLPTMTPNIARKLSVVDSYDNHSTIPEHFERVNEAALAGGTVALISMGWDPGMFSVNRGVAEAILVEGQTYTFWGPGVSQGHSDAVRRIPGVLDARQYTLPVADAVERVRSGEAPELATREKHRRDCYVVLAEDADADAVREAIVTMPGYFADYDTEVHFVDQATLERDHAGLPHGGHVIRSGRTDDATLQTIEYRLALESNPQFTGAILVAGSRAVHRMAQEGRSGAITVLDIPPTYLSSRPDAELRASLL